MLNLRHLQYLNAVYQYKNFTQAGDSLFVSQPTISAAINTLESDLGVKLIERSSKRVIFTYEGEKILLLCQEAESATRDLSDSAEQQLRLGMSYAFMDSTAPLVFSDFLKEHPQGKIHLDEGSMQKHLQMIQSEKLDLAYNGFPDTQDLPGIETIPISKAEIRIVRHWPTSRRRAGRHILRMMKVSHGAVRILSPILCAIRWWSVRSSFTSQPEALVIF